ncbi:MAG: glycosyltransferase [Bacillota bacterium]
MVDDPTQELKPGLFVPPRAERAAPERSVLLVSYLFPPVGGGGVQRALKMARYLPEFGWRPIVVAVSQIPPGFPRDDRLLGELPEDVSISRVPEPRMLRSLFTGVRSATAPAKEGPRRTDRPSPSTRIRGRLRRFLRGLRDHLLCPDERVFWVRPASSEGFELTAERDVSAVLSTSGPVSNHLAARRIARATGLPWIADFRDPWVGNIHWRDLPRGRQRREERMERRVLADAHAITAVTKSFCEDYAARYPHHPVGLIYNGFDPADYRGLPEDPPSEAPLTLVYAGTLYPRRSPRIFFEALRGLIDSGEVNRGDVRLIFAGTFDYSGHSENRDLVEHLDLQDSVFPVGNLAHRTVLELMARADGLLLIGDDDEEAGSYIPGKIYEYLALGKPVVGCLARGEARDILEASGRALICDPGDVGDAREMLRTFVASRGRPGGGYDPDLSPYRRDHQAAQMAWILDRLTGDNAD